MADLSSYTPIYVRTTGDDTTGDGSAGSPYATAQKAFDIALAAGTGNYVIDLGVGSFGGVTLTANWPSRIAVRGVSVAQSNLGGISGTGANQIVDFENQVWVSDATAGFSVALVSDKSCNLGGVVTNGGRSYGYLAEGGDPSGKSAGSVTLTDAHCGDIQTLGGAANRIDIGQEYGGWPPQHWESHGGNGGNVILSGCVVVGEIATVGGENGYNGGNGGNAGSVMLTNTTVGAHVITVGGGILSTGMTKNIGSGGDVTLTTSNVGGFINANTGPASNNEHSGYGVYPGNVLLSASTAQSISSSGTYGSTPQNGGSVTVINGSVVAGDIVANGGSSIDQCSNGGSVTVTDSACQNISVNAGDGNRYGGGGSVTVTRSTCGNISARGQFAYYDAGASGGSVTAVDSTVGAIDCTGSYCGAGAGGNGGTVSITNGSVSSIDVSPGSGAAYCVSPANGAIGSVTIIGTTVLPSVVAGGTLTTTNLKKGRGVNGSGILGIT